MRMNRRMWLASTAGFGLSTLAAAWPALAQGTGERPSLKQFAATPKVEDIALSSDGKRIALTSWEGNERLLVIADLVSGARTVSHVGEAKLRALFWAGPDHIVFETSMTYALDEFFQAHVLDTRTGKAVTLFENMPGLRNYIYGDLDVLRRDGKYYLTASTSNVNISESYTLFEYDLNKAAYKVIDGGKSGTEGWVLQPDGALVGRSGVDFRKTTREFWYVEYFIDGKWKEIYRQEIITDQPSLIGLGNDGVKLVVYLRGEGEAGTYREIGPDGVFGPALFDGREDTHPLFHPVTRRMCGSVVSGDWPVYHYDAPLMKDIQSAVDDLAVKGERIRRVDIADDPRKLLLYTEGPGNAGSYFYSDFTTGDIVDIATCYPDIAREWITEKRVIQYPAADGLIIPAYLTLPPGREAKNLPLVVLPHGGPNARDTLAFDWKVQAYASMGYAVLQPNFRGSTGYGWAFLKAGFGEYGRKMQTDLSDGVRYLAGQGIVDASRVAIVGSSYGGYAALAGATIDTGVYRCAVSVSGVSDPEYFYLHTTLHENTGYRFVKRMLGDGNINEISPVKNADKADIPILLIHGIDDTVVSIEQSERMERALKKAGKSCEFVRLKGEDHWMSREATRIEMINAAGSFLQKHNPA